MITDREALGKELQRILDEKTNPWGITVQSVEIRDVQLPKELEDAMSRRAQAERERQARIILGTAETEISEKFAAASVVYQNNPVALHLRAMNMLYEAIKERGSMIIVPSSAVETMGLGSMMGAASLAGARVPGGDVPRRSRGRNRPFPSGTGSRKRRMPCARTEIRAGRPGTSICTPGSTSHGWTSAATRRPGVHGRIGRGCADRPAVDRAALPGVAGVRHRRGGAALRVAPAASGSLIRRTIPGDCANPEHGPGAGGSPDLAIRPPY